MMKIRIALAGLVAFGLVLLGFNTRESAEEKVQTSLLWKVEKEGMSKSSYLFGTMHMIQKEYYYFPESLKKLIKKSDVIATEIDLDDLTDQSKAVKYLTLKEGTIMDFFTPNQQDTLLGWVKKKLMMDRKTFEMTFSNFKPFILVQTMMQMELMGKTESYEMTISELAKKYKIETVGFETIAEQISFFDGLSKEKQAEMVMEGIRNEGKNLEMLNEVQGLYKRQQVDSLYAMMHAEKSVIMEEEELFLNKRNKNWLPQIEKLIQNKTAFIAVGAGHLGGDQGVIKLLRTRGYTLTPVKF